MLAAIVHLYEAINVELFKFVGYNPSLLCCDCPLLVAAWSGLPEKRVSDLRFFAICMNLHQCTYFTLALMTPVGFPFVLSLVWLESFRLSREHYMQNFFMLGGLEITLTELSFDTIWLQVCQPGRHLRQVLLFCTCLDFLAFCFDWIVSCQGKSQGINTDLPWHFLCATLSNGNGT